MTVDLNWNNYIGSGMDYTTYMELFQRLFDERATTGEDQSEAMVQYTFLNFHRSKRLNKTIKLHPQLKDALNQLRRPLHLVALTESWCGDAAQLLPIFNKIEEESDLVTLEIFLRDENLELMDAFLTNGGRSIPKVIAIDKETHEVLWDWGPRPDFLMKRLEAYKVDPKGQSQEEFKKDLQLWYAKDKTYSAQMEIANLLNKS